MNNIKNEVNEFIHVIGYNIMRIRLNKGIYLTAVARRMNISVYVLKNIEKGKYHRMNIGTIMLLAECLEAKVDDLFEGT